MTIRRAPGNIIRNLAGHGITAAAISAMILVLTRVDGWFGRHFSAAEAHIAKREIVPLLWWTVPPFILVTLVAHFVIPKTNIRRTGGLHPEVVWTPDDPYRLMWPARVLGVALTAAISVVWGQVLVRWLAALLGPTP